MRLEGDGRMLAALAMVTQLGFIVVACVVGGLLLGMFLDRQLGTAPAMTITLMLLGVAGGMLAAYRIIVHSIEEASDQEKTERSSEDANVE